MRMLRSHPSSLLEYWFFKVNRGPIALLVDWIERRRPEEHLLRVSIHSPHGREVIIEQLDSLMPGDNFLSRTRTIGHSGGVSWALDIDLGSERIRPDVFPAGLLGMPDLLYESAPLARFSGWISHGPVRTTLDGVYGAVTHYWGRKLAREWWWLSAHQFDRPDVAIECTVFRTGLWGTSVHLPFAFLYLHRDGKRDFWMAPPARVRAGGSPDAFRVEFSRIGREKITLVGTGREYGDFGGRILNTLTGDLEVYEGGRRIARARGTAGLERRAPDPR